MCCTGVLFNRVELQPEDSAERLTALGVKIEGTSERPLFKLPCTACTDRRCTIYKDRPVRCRSFHCRTLLRAGSGEITATQAMEIIQRAVEQARRIESLLESANERDTGKTMTRRYDDAMTELSARPNDPSTLQLAHDLAIAMQTFQEQLTADFRVPPKDAAKITDD